MMNFIYIFSWYKYDDNYITRMMNNEVISSAAYILFYVNQQISD